MAVPTEIPDILETFNQEIPFLQPLYEAIVNSLEANASNIYIELFSQKKVGKDKIVDERISGFQIVDDGDGFNGKNRKSFSTYLTDLKRKDFGCKGVGRFTWLKVFQNVKIESHTGEDFTSFDFNINFSPEVIKYKPDKTPKLTSIIFEDVTPDYYTDDNQRRKDKRVEANLETIKASIEENLMVKLFLLHTEGKKNFCINLKLKTKETKITNEDVIGLDKISLEIIENSDITNHKVTPKHEFHLYYKFIKDNKKKRIMSYCGNERHVANFTKKTRITALPDENDSVIMLLTSKYLDKRVNSERNGFFFKMGDNIATETNPIVPAQIDNKLKSIIDRLIIETYPNIQSKNDEIVENVLNANPHLSKYIKQDDSLVKDPEKLLDKAETEFAREKKEIRQKFTKMLVDKKIDPSKYEKNIKDLNDICARELGEYILYREQIIECLKKLKDSPKEKEAVFHNLFMKMGESSSSEDNTLSRYDTNIWLLDDKFMSYTNMFSDKSITQIKKELAEYNEKTIGQKKEPDLTMFFNNSIDKFKDLVVVELKAADISSDRKAFALTEINRNLGYILKHIPNIRSVYGYVITNLDEEFCTELEMQPEIKQLFSNDNAPIYYLYNGNLKDMNNQSKDCHIYFLSYDTICADAGARNKTFLDIIKNN